MSDDDKPEPKSEERDRLPPLDVEPYQVPTQRCDAVLAHVRGKEPV